MEVFSTYLFISENNRRGTAKAIKKKIINNKKKTALFPLIEGFNQSNIYMQPQEGNIMIFPQHLHCLEMRYFNKWSSINYQQTGAEIRG